MLLLVVVIIVMIRRGGDAGGLRHPRIPRGLLDYIIYDV